MKRERCYKNFMQLNAIWPQWRPQTGKVVFTNGCFDLLHAGHVAYLEEARGLGSFLVLGLNSDESIRRLKGPRRPIVTMEDRAAVLAGLRSIDLVVGFDEDTPYELIRHIEPDVLVKGGDWQPSQIVGSDLVTARGGEVRSLQFKTGRSTTGMVEKVLASYGLDQK